MEENEKKIKFQLPIIRYLEIRCLTSMLYSAECMLWFSAFFIAVCEPSIILQFKYRSSKPSIQAAYRSRYEFLKTTEKGNFFSRIAAHREKNNKKKTKEKDGNIYMMLIAWSIFSSSSFSVLFSRPLRCFSGINYRCINVRRFMRSLNDSLMHFTGISRRKANITLMIYGSHRVITESSDGLELNNSLTLRRDEIKLSWSGYREISEPTLWIILMRLRFGWWRMLRGRDSCFGLRCVKRMLGVGQIQCNCKKFW